MSVFQHTVYAATLSPMVNILPNSSRASVFDLISADSWQLLGWGWFSLQQIVAAFMSSNIQPPSIATIEWQCVLRIIVGQHSLVLSMCVLSVCVYSETAGKSAECTVSDGISAGPSPRSQLRCYTFITSWRGPTHTHIYTSALSVKGHVPRDRLKYRSAVSIDRVDNHIMCPAHRSPAKTPHLDVTWPY